MADPGESQIDLGAGRHGSSPRRQNQQLSHRHDHLHGDEQNRSRGFASEPPARTTVGTIGLANLAMQIEIEAISLAPVS